MPVVLFGTKLCLIWVYYREELGNAVKLVSIIYQKHCLLGIIFEDRVYALESLDPGLPTSMRDLLEQLPDLTERFDPPPKSAKPLEGQVKFGPPIPDPEKVICIGLNYADHAAESGSPIPNEPVVFNKFPTAIRGPEDNIELPPQSDAVDYEAELVVVIGKAGKTISKDKALDHVAGYTCGHDVSARDWQKDKPAGQWLCGKSFDSFAPIGPVLVTSDEITDPHNLRVQMRLNGETMQDSTTAQLIFNVPHLIAYISQVCTLKPGDLIFTGTPPGVGMARKPPVLLKPGDTCEVEVEGIGILSNPVVAAK